MINNMKDMINKLNVASDAYYNGNAPIMSDAEWDALFDELKAMETETGVIMSNSPTQKVGYEVKSELQKVKHEYPMLSLDKTKSLEELQGFAKNKACVLSLKMDGLSIRLTYENGDLVRAETRGDGEIGEDVTHNARVIKNIPLHIRRKEKYIIDGECIITYDDFESINAKLSEDQKYKNPRNLASGSIRQLDSKIAAERNLRFVAWRVIEGSDTQKDYHDDLIDAEWRGFTIVSFSFFNRSSEITQNDIDNLRDIADKEKYPIDGLVITFNDIEYGKSLGKTERFPRHSHAFKFANDTIQTTLRDIEWGLGKTGELTPVAIFDTVELEGTEVSRANLHNLSIMKSLWDEPWYKGLKVNVFKANQIIPAVKSVEAGNRKPKKKDYLPIPETCPKCGQLLKICKGVESEALCCVNPDCEGILLGKLAAFVSKKGMDIRGLSEKTIEKMISYGKLKTFKDIYYLKNNQGHLFRIEGMGVKKVENIVEAVEKSREVTLEKFLPSLSIPNVGRSAAKLISQHCDGVDDFFEKWKSGYHWSKITGIGEILEKDLNDYARANWDEIMELVQELHFIDPKSKVGEAPVLETSLLGKTFVITGKLEYFKNRKEIEEYIKDLGGTTSGSVSKNTTALINNDINSTSSKNKKAKSLGVPIWTEEEFLKKTKFN